MDKRQPWKVDAPGERARRYAQLDNAAGWIAELAEKHAPLAVSVHELGGWALFQVGKDAEGAVWIRGNYTHQHRVSIERAMSARGVAA